MTETDITVARCAHGAELLLNRPAARNALSLSMWSKIPELVAQAAADPAVRVLIIRGTGTTFSGGVDIQEFEQAYSTPAAAAANQDIIQSGMRAIEDFPKPTLAAIDGPCYGGACGLALCCDLRFATARARFAITPAKLGLVYGLSDTRRLIAAIGVSRAKDMLFTGRAVNADEALAIGLIDRIASPEDIETTVSEFATALKATAGSTAQATKQIIRRLQEGQADDDEKTRTMFAAAFGGADFREGLAAFKERRPPRFD